MVGIVFLLPLANVVVDVVSDVVGMVIVLTGLVAGAFRSWAVMSGFAPERVEWFTAIGFAGGVAIAAAILFLDQFVR